MLHLLFATLWHLSGYFSEFLYQLIKIILQDEWISKNDHSYGRNQFRYPIKEYLVYVKEMQALKAALRKEKQDVRKTKIGFLFSKSRDK